MRLFIGPPVFYEQKIMLYAFMKTSTKDSPGSRRCLPSCSVEGREQEQVFCPGYKSFFVTLDSEMLIEEKD